MIESCGETASQRRDNQVENKRAVLRTPWRTSKCSCGSSAARSNDLDARSQVRMLESVGRILSCAPSTLRTEIG